MTELETSRLCCVWVFVACSVLVKHNIFVSMISFSKSSWVLILKAFPSFWFHEIFSSIVQTSDQSYCLPEEFQFCLRQIFVDVNCLCSKVDFDLLTNFLAYISFSRYSICLSFVWNELKLALVLVCTLNISFHLTCVQYQCP